MWTIWSGLKTVGCCTLIVHDSQAAPYGLNPKDRMLKACLPDWYYWNHVLNDDTMTLPLLSFSLLPSHHKRAQLPWSHVSHQNILPCHRPQGNRLRPLKPWRRETIPRSLPLRFSLWNKNLSTGLGHLSVPLGTWNQSLRLPMMASIYPRPHCHFQMFLLHLFPDSALWEASHVRFGLPHTVIWASLPGSVYSALRLYPSPFFRIYVSWAPGCFFPLILPSTDLGWRVCSYLLCHSFWCLLLKSPEPVSLWVIRGPKPGDWDSASFQIMMPSSNSSLCLWTSVKSKSSSFLTAHQNHWTKLYPSYHVGPALWALWGEHSAGST